MQGLKELVLAFIGVLIAGLFFATLMLVAAEAGEAAINGITTLYETIFG